MAVHTLDDGTCTISAHGTWLPGCYENERTAKLALTVSDSRKSQLRDAAIARGDGIIKHSDISLDR